MKRQRAIALTLITALLTVPACTGPTASAPTPDMTATFAVALTQAMGTAQANLPAAEASATAVVAEATALPAPSATLAPTDTSAPPPMAASPVTPCTDAVTFVDDVTVPDGTVFPAPVGFLKTWRVRNSGTCTWTTSYSLRFLSGDALGGPPAVSFTSEVAPGGTLDISVNLSSPAAPGDYTGRWRLTNAAGAGFYTVVVKITVPGVPTPLAPTITPTLALVPVITIPVPLLHIPVSINIGTSSQGGVFSPPATVFGAPNAGDDDSNASRQGFATFSLAPIPAGSTITAVELDLAPYDQIGNPFSLGCLRVYQQNYGTLGTGDFFAGAPTGALWRFCSAAQLSDAAVRAAAAGGLAAVQSSLAAGQFQIRLQFNENATNSNGSSDLLRPSPRLVVTYTTP